MTIPAAILAYLQADNFDAEPVPGGDINQCYRLYNHQQQYFLKLNDAARFPQMLQQEANGLDALRNNSDFCIPQVLQAGVVDQMQFLLMEWMEPATQQPQSWTQFGNSLANMHRTSQPYFGWTENNYIGSLQQQNTPCHHWSNFYAACRLLPLITQLYDAGVVSKSTMANAERLCKQLPNLFPHEAPALLHGDLWSGNCMFITSGHTSIFDPAVYYGHREMDLGMTKLFGGFAPAFYDAYNVAFPLQQGWEQRLPLTHLYPLLVHAVLFGGHYISKSESIIQQFA